MRKINYKLEICRLKNALTTANEKNQQLSEQIETLKKENKEYKKTFKLLDKMRAVNENEYLRRIVTQALGKE